MSGKDFLRLLLVEYGFTKKIEIKTYHGDDLSIGYDIEAEDNNGNQYGEENCEGLMFNIYSIIEYMQKNNIEILPCGTNTHLCHMSVKDFLSDEQLEKYNNRIIENEKYISQFRKCSN